jgi:photosystem II stability/assembly factor-like uncharacterized protein
MPAMRLLVGTVGQSILASEDMEKWERVGPRRGMHSDGIVRAMHTHPKDPKVIFAGTDKGIMRSDDGFTWEPVGGPLASYTIWSIAFDDRNPDVMFAGTGTPTLPKIFRSRDGGKSWHDLNVDAASECDNVGIPRVTEIAVDPLDPRHVWASFEVDGFRHSADGGDTWERIDVGNSTYADGHGVAVSPGPPKTVFLVRNNEIFASTDDGQSWTTLNTHEKFPMHHVRHLMFDAWDPKAAWASIGDYTPGDTGALMRTTDFGESWTTVNMPVAPNSSMWAMRTQPDDPKLMFAATRYGYLYRSGDAGKSWEKIRREFSEVAAMVWTPN